ncbi:MAG: hypothetical protein L6R41_004961 [Letrouitia leprolyta]|nr:MAG: hypothetical protein L6R41_004961 [Letrouitia leprolyta]
MASISPPKPVGNLSKIPVEIRIMIYGHVFRFQKPIRITKQSDLIFFKYHRSICLMNKHETVGSNIICTNPFDEHDVTVYEAPPTVLDLLLTCKTISEEAMPVFFAINSFVFPDFAGFQYDMVWDRFRAIKNVTLVRSEDVSVEVEALCGLSQLEALTVIFPARPQLPLKYKEAGPRMERTIELLGALRGVKELRMAGRDRVWTGNGKQRFPKACVLYHEVVSEDDAEVVDKPGKWRWVDVNHERAFGSWVRERVTQPKPERYLVDMDILINGPDDD